MGDLQAIAGPIFPEVSTGDELMAEPDRLVVLVADGVRVAQACQGMAARAQHGVEEGAAARTG